MARVVSTTKPVRRKTKPKTANRSVLVRTYKSALNYITTHTNYETMSRVGYNHTNFNLARMNRLLALLGNPHRKIKTVHIAGTKGKGSTATMVSGMLQGNDYNVGLYTSPHVLDIRERITVNDTWISEHEFTRLTNQLALTSKKLKGSQPTFFEMMTAMAFLYFVDKKVDFAVIETGLGGRLDATNVIRPEVCGITSISIDHTLQLGNTITQIAHEKAGIFKSNVPAISAPQHPEAKRILKKVASEQGTPLLFAGEDIEFSYRFESSRLAGPHTRVCLTTPNSRFEHLQVPLLGEHQAINCGLALSLVDVLKTKGYRIDDQKAADGLSRVRMTGRMEIIHSNPKILVDGAHNAASIEALMRTIGQHVPYDSMIVIFGCQEGKDIDGMIRQIQLGADKIIFTRSSSPLAADPRLLASRFFDQTGNTVQVAENLDQALQIASIAVTPEDLICITGSFYLVGDAKKKFAS